MIPMIQPWLYTAISEATLGDGYESIMKPIKAVILKCSRDRRFLQIYDMKYSCIAIVDNKNPSLQDISKNGVQELIGCIINIIDFHFLCASCKSEGYDKYLLMHINNFTIISKEKYENTNLHVKDVMSLGSISSLVNLYPTGLIRMLTQDTCSCTTIDGNIILKAILHENPLPEAIPQSQNGSLLLSQIPITQDSVGSSTPSKEQIPFSNTSQEGSDMNQPTSQLLTQPPSQPSSSSVSQLSDLPFGQSMSPSQSLSHSQEKVQNLSFNSSQEKIPSQSSNSDRSQLIASSQDKIQNQSFNCQTIPSSETTEESYSFGHSFNNSPNPVHENSQSNMNHSSLHPSQDKTQSLSLHPSQDNSQQNTELQTKSPSDDIVMEEEKSLLDQLLEDSSIAEEDTTSISTNNALDRSELLDRILEEDEDSSSHPSHDSLINGENNVELKENEKQPEQNMEDESIVMKENEKQSEQNMEDESTELKENEKQSEQNMDSQPVELKENEKQPEQNMDTKPVESKENEKQPIQNIETESTESTNTSDESELSFYEEKSSNRKHIEEELDLSIKKEVPNKRNMNETTSIPIKQERKNEKKASLQENDPYSVFEITELLSSSSSSSSDHEIDDFVERCTSGRTTHTIDYIKAKKEKDSSINTDSSKQDFTSDRTPSSSQPNQQNTKKRKREMEENPAEKRVASTRDLFEKAVDNVEEEIAFADSKDSEEHSFTSSVIASDSEMTEEIVNAEIAHDIANQEKTKHQELSNPKISYTFPKVKKEDKNENRIVHIIDSDSDSDSNEWESRWGS